MSFTSVDLPEPETPVTAVSTPSGTLALVVGDVMGRGVRAATTMIRVRAGIRGLLTVDPAPRAVLTAADELMTRDAPDQFVTAAAVLAGHRIALDTGERLRLWPHIHGTDGFFAAILVRNA